MLYRAEIVDVNAFISYATNKMFGNYSYRWIGLDDDGTQIFETQPVTISGEFSPVVTCCLSDSNGNILASEQFSLI